jgi:hemerythrin-like domain-containing protein
MNAITLLKKQHQEVRDLFARYDAADSSNEKEAIIQDLADNVAAHMTIEEQMFYPTVFESADEAMHTRSVEEHATVKRILADLLSMSPDDNDYDDKVTMLQEHIEVHVEEEESETFKLARKELSAEALKQLGEEMKMLFDEEMANNPSDALSQQNMATPPPARPHAHH